MSSASFPTSRPTSPGPAGDAVVARRIRFADDVAGAAPPPNARRFAQPRAVVAVTEERPLGDLLTGAETPGAEEGLGVVCSPKEVPAELRRTIEAWVDAAAPAGAAPAIVVELDAARVLWRPGRAWVQGSAGRCKEALGGLVDFAFYEGELRRLERELSPYESAAADDVPFALRIRSGGRDRWERFARTVEHLFRLRLIYARLEPQLYLPPRALPLAARRLVSRLRARADIADRLEAFNDRLEACEELYEGAVDRITDHRWYERGLLLEAAIVALLLLEAALIAWQAYHH